MKRIISLFLICTLVRVSLAQTTNYKVLSNEENQTIIDITIGKINQVPVITPNGNEVKITLDKGTAILSKANPDLPKLAFSMIIPNHKNSKISILESQFKDYPNILIAPSKGTITRDINPASLPFIYGDVYQKNEFFPAATAMLNTPYILRDFRGQTVMLNPVQYNPITKTMRVFTHMKVKIEFDRMATENVIDGDALPKTIAEEFDGIYKNHFINYELNKTLYSPVTEQGSLLVLCPGAYLGEINPFVEWKEQKGIKTYLVNIDTLSGGVNNTTIQNIAHWYFQHNQIAYLLLVGDSSNIPAINTSAVKGPSDNAYAYVNGNDHYPDFVVGRFSGESTDDIKTQVVRTLQYEQFPNTSGNWMRTQIGIGSAEGTGDDNQYDWEHMHDIVDSNKNQYNYLTNVEMYDGVNPMAGTDLAGDPNATQLTDAINDGCSLINYCGHGGWDGIVTSHFTIPDVANLTNDNRLPFVLTVGCRPGAFTTLTCFSETLQRARIGNQAYGSISNFMSTVDQYWDEPMQAQDEFNAILRGARPANLKYRLGAVCMDACMSMNDQYNNMVGNPNGLAAGSDMTDTWVYFGDPTLSLFTKNEGTISFTNDVHIQQNSTLFEVHCPVVGATIGLFYQGKYLASGVSNGGITYFSFPAITVLDTVHITATKANYIPAYGYSEVVNWPTNIHEINSQQGLEIYPNPSSDFLTLNVKGNGLIQQINIMDAFGNVVQSQTVNNKTCTLHIKQLATGVYTLQAGINSANTNGETYTTTFIKK